MKLVERVWDGAPGATTALAGALLTPPEVLYRAATALRNAAYDRHVLPSTRADVPVISIGNIAVGGAGKTPFTSWMAQRLRDRGERPAIVHGGYAADEPELHRTWTPEIPVIVDRDRVRAVAKARELDASVAVLDDAFQHRRLRRDLDIVLVSVERWDGARRLLPRGPWREPPGALRRADLVVCMRRTDVGDAAARLAQTLGTLSGRPVLHARLDPDAWQRGDRFGAVHPADPAPDAPALLVAGVAHPALVQENARTAGAAIAATLVFRDHHAYDERDADRIRAAAAGRPVITTAKDWIKLRALLDPERTWVLVQRLHVDDPGGTLDAALDRVLR